MQKRPWTKEEEAYLAEWWGKKNPSLIAVHLNRKKTAVIRRAQKLGVKETRGVGASKTAVLAAIQTAGEPQTSAQVGRAAKVSASVAWDHLEQAVKAGLVTRVRGRMARRVYWMWVGRENDKHEQEL